MGFCGGESSLEKGGEEAERDEGRKANVCSQSETACSPIPTEFGANTEPHS